MTGRRLGEEGSPRTRYHGPADFLMPDGEHFVAQCEARYARERWQGVVNLQGFDRGLERGDVCRLSADQLGELRIIILDKTGSFRYEFIALVKPDPFESL
jgi:hypothetical protein